MAILLVNHQHGEDEKLQKGNETKGCRKIVTCLKTPIVEIIVIKYTTAGTGVTDLSGTALFHQ